MNETTNDPNKDEEDSAVITEPNDENPASYFCIPSRPNCNDSWSLN